MRVLQELMGHSSIQMTEKYSHIDMTAKHTAIQLLDYKNESGGHFLGSRTLRANVPKAKHNQNMAVLSSKMIDREENHL